MRKIEKLENETVRKQTNLEQLRREKIELENTLEQEQEALVNKLWKKLDKLENEKRDLRDKLETLSAASNCSFCKCNHFAYLIKRCANSCTFVPSFHQQRKPPISRLQCK